MKKSWSRTKALLKRARTRKAALNPPMSNWGNVYPESVIPLSGNLRNRGEGKEVYTYRPEFGSGRLEHGRWKRAFNADGEHGGPYPYIGDLLAAAPRWKSNARNVTRSILQMPVSRSRSKSKSRSKSRSKSPPRKTHRGTRGRGRR